MKRRRRRRLEKGRGSAKSLRTLRSGNLLGMPRLLLSLSLRMFRVGRASLLPSLHLRLWSGPLPLRPLSGHPRGGLTLTLRLVPPRLLQLDHGKLPLPLLLHLRRQLLLSLLSLLRLPPCLLLPIRSCQSSSMRRQRRLLRMRGRCLGVRGGRAVLRQTATGQPWAPLR